MTLLLDAKALSKKIDGVIRSATKLRETVHQLALSTTMHALVHGDPTLLNKLTLGLSNEGKTAIRTNELRQWVLDNMPWLTWGTQTIVDPNTKEKTTKALFTINKDERDKAMAEYEADQDAFIGELISLTPFYEKHKEPEFKPFNLKAEMAKLMKRAEQRQKKGDARDDLSGLDQVKATFASMQVKTMVSQTGGEIPFH